MFFSLSYDITEALDSKGETNQGYSLSKSVVPSGIKPLQKVTSTTCSRFESNYAILD